MNTASLPITASSPKTGASDKADPTGHGHGGQHGAGADSALGFLAELAAAIGAVGTLGPALPVPGQQSDQQPGQQPGPLSGKKPGLPGKQAAAPAGDVLASTPLSVAQHGTAAAPPPSTVLGATPHAPVPATAGDGAVTGRTPDLTAPAGQGHGQGHGPENGPIGPATPVLTAAPTATDAAATPIGPFSGRPAAATTPRPQRPAHAKAPGAASAVDDRPVPSTPAGADSALRTDSAAAGIDAVAAAAASTSTAPPTGDSTQQTTAVLRQVFPEITAVASTPGTHRLAITLHPADLGEVRVTVVVRGDSVRVNVATDPTNGIARTALEHGAPELRQLLESTGANARVDFRDLGAAIGAGLGSATDGGHQQQQQQSQGFAQAQAQTFAQGESESRRQPRPQAEQPPVPRPAVAVAEVPAPHRGTQLLPVRRAASGLDQLI